MTSIQTILNQQLRVKNDLENEPIRPIVHKNM